MFDSGSPTWFTVEKYERIHHKIGVMTHETQLCCNKLVITNFRLNHKAFHMWLAIKITAISPILGLLYLRGSMEPCLLKNMEIFLSGIPSSKCLISCSSTTSCICLYALEYGFTFRM